MSKKIGIFFIVLLLIFSLSTPSRNIYADIKDESDITKVQILTFNDFHGNFNENGKDVGAAKFVGEIKKLKNENKNTIVLSGGDIFQGTAISNLLYGEPIIKMFQEIGVTYSAVGNHEFDWGVERISKWAQDGKFKFLASNIYDKITNKPVEWSEPYAIAEFEGKKIGFIGLTTEETAYKTKLENIKNIEFKNIIESTNYWAKFLKDKKKVDAVIVLGHIGSEQDEKTKEIKGEAAEIAKSVKGIDAIISAHTHLEVCGNVNGVPILQALKNGREIGKLNITFNKDGKVSVDGEIDNLSSKVNELSNDTTMKNIMDNYNSKLDPILKEVVTNVNTPLEHSKDNGLSPLGQFIGKYTSLITNTDIVINNGGGLRKPLQEGDITIGDMWEVLPFDNTLVTMKLKGEDLKKVLENGIMNDKIGWVQYYGINAYYDKNKDQGNRITSMRLLNGNKVEMEKYYTVTTNDFMAEGGDGYDFSNAIDKKDTGIPMRDALINELKKYDKIDFKFDSDALIAGSDKIVDGKPDSNNTSDSGGKDPVVNQDEINSVTNKKDEEYIKKLPTTGTPLGSDELLIVGVTLIIIGFIVGKSKKII